MKKNDINSELEKLTSEQRMILQNQVERFRELSYFFPVVDSSLVCDNRIILKERTLVYGAGAFSYEKVFKILENGFLGNLFNGKFDDKVNPYCANFCVIPRDISLIDFNANFDRNYNFPFGRLGSMDGANCLAFIISKNDSKLFDFDLYKSCEEASVTRSFADVKKLYIKRYDEVASILYGVPSNMVLGIVLGDNLFRDLKIVEVIIDLFPNCYIATKNGEVIYFPGSYEYGKDSVDLRTSDYNLLTDKYRWKVSQKRRK